MLSRYKINKILMKRRELFNIKKPSFDEIEQKFARIEELRKTYGDKAEQVYNEEKYIELCEGFKNR